MNREPEVATSPVTHREINSTTGLDDKRSMLNGDIHNNKVEAFEVLLCRLIFSNFLDFLFIIFALALVRLQDHWCSGRSFKETARYLVQLKSSEEKSILRVATGLSSRSPDYL